MKTLYLIEKEYISMMDGTSTQFVGIFSTYELAEHAVMRQYDIKDFTRSEKNRSIWMYVYDGTLTEYYGIREVGLDLTMEEYDELKSREVLDRERDEARRIFTEGAD